jgi:protein-S-isoprenylcysteine O-methyltransferase Ste14
MPWIVAGLIAGVVAYLADWLMWSKVFTTGMDQYVTPPPAGQPIRMGPMLAKSAVLALVFGVLLAFVYRRWSPALWVQGGGVLAGLEFATTLWLLTIAMSTLGGSIWFDKARPLHTASFWSWLVRMNAAGVVIGLFVR